MITKKLQIGAVVIGRNEGERLKVCLHSLRRQVENIVYVDSGSTDGSVSYAKSIGVEVVELNLSTPFTAARARNAGARYLLRCLPDIDYIQFLDGDCEIVDGWIPKASEFLYRNEQYAIACGRRRERYPEQSIYNQLCDIEWNTAEGDANACGGDSLIRADVFQAVGGYRESMIAGEEPEMCFRLRHAGWKIRRLDQEMTLHDADMTKVSQWWKRHIRAGHAYAEGFFLHGTSIERYKIKECRSIVSWSGLFLSSLCLGVFFPSMLLILILFPIQCLRLTLRDGAKYDYPLSLIVSCSNLMSKLPQFIGLVKFYVNRVRGRAESIIEYK